MARTDISAVLERIRMGEASPEDEALAKSWLHQLNGDQVPGVSDEEMEVIGREMWQYIQAREVPVRRLWPRIAAAASILIALGAGVFYISHKKQVPMQTAQVIKQDIAPGHNQATLTLANGKKIILTKGLNGLLATQGKTAINASGNTIVYNATKADQSVSYNTLSTARGEQSPYPLVLPDGSKVWLNAESSITFPTAFTGKQRRVTITGEAYVEVAHNSKQPFQVDANGVTIEDIGTQFNINAYKDEPNVTTSLIEGAVKVSHNSRSVLLKPGEQAAADAQNMQIKKVDIDEAIAWRSGYFSFNGQDIQGVIRQLARWYNLNVQYQGQLPQNNFKGEISRNVNASKVFKQLKDYGIDCRLQGNNLIISKI